VQTWVSENSTDADDYPKLRRKSLEHYLSTLRQVIDFCDIEPNPARSTKVRLPEEVREEVAPPSAEEWNAIKDNIRKRSSLAVRVTECDGLRLASETLRLSYGDIDFVSERIRVSQARTKGRTAGQRWLPIPRVLLHEIANLVPLEDRHRNRLVFPNITEAQVRQDVARACRDAGIAHYHPHDLRDRRISLWIAQGIDAVQAKTSSGHTNASMTLDVYAHVVIDPNADEWRDFWHSRYVTGRSPGVVSVRHRPAENFLYASIQADA
jgi:integrase